MYKAKRSLWLKLLACFTVALMVFGVVFALPNLSKKDVGAKAETVEYQDLLAIENRSWGAASDEYYFGGYTIGASTANNAHWLNTANSVNGCWYHGNDALIAANNGVDILKYIYINDMSARDAITANVNSSTPMVGSSGWLTNPAASPVYVETTNGSGLLIKILKAYAGDSFTLTFKAGFSLIKNDGNVLYVSDDVIYNCVGNEPTRVQKSTVMFNDENGVVYKTKRVITGKPVGELPEVPEKAGYVGYWLVDGNKLETNTIINTNQTATPIYALDYTDLWGIEDRSSWATDNSNIACFGGVTLEPFGYFITAGGDCWYQGNSNVITQNNGVDILQYIYINGECARDLLVNNQAEGKVMSGTGSWLSNSAAWPIAIETNGDIWIRVDKTAFGGDFTITFKAGFSLIRNDGEVICITDDITYTYANGVLGGRTVDKTYTLSFEGADESKQLKNGANIGALPEVPTKSGCEGVWTIDGVEITADTVYNYGANKTAKAVYSKNITATIGLGDWGVPETESDIRYLWIRDNNTEIATSYPNSYWNDHEDNKNSNFGVDIMEYILIDGESVRSIINANAAGTTSYKATSTFPLNMGGCYAPICIETAGDGIRFKVMVAYKTSFKVTFKAGFTLVNSEGIRLYTTEDVVYNVGASAGDISKVTGYTLTFDGVETRILEDGQTIGALPEVPEKDGCEGVWTIDGVEITANTVYNYGVNKTAKVVYSKDITETIGLGDWGVPASESDIRYLWIRNNNTEIATAYPYEYWNDHEDNKNSNFGVDILEYILIDGESVRSIINANVAGTTSYKASTTFPLSHGGCYAPIALSTLGDGARFKVMVDYKTEFELTFKAGFTMVSADGVKLYTTEDVVYTVAENGIAKNIECILSFEGLEETITVVNGQPIGSLPAVPEKDGCEGVWSIDGVEITTNTIYNYGIDKKAVAMYKADISRYLALEDRSSWFVCGQGGELSFGVLDMREGNKTLNGEGAEVKYLNSNNTGCWYYGNDALIAANGGVDIMEYIYLNDKSARELITENVNGSNLVNSCGCWLSNPAASPIYVETSVNNGIMIKLLQAYIGNYFEITFKSGFSLVNDQNVRVFLTKDVTYKYIKTDDGTTFAKGELTDADLDMLNGQYVTLKNGNEDYLVKKTARLTLPEIEPTMIEQGLSEVLIGWTTDTSFGAGFKLYPAGYKLDVTEQMTLHAVWLGFEMQDGAAVRIVNDSNGIRFLVDIDAGGYNLGVQKGLILGVGTFLVPTDYLETGIKFAHSSFNNSNYYLDKPTETWRVNGETDATWTYAASFVNISESQFARSLSARGYLKIQFTTGVGYVYTPYVEEDNARSIYDVALLAYKDEENPQYKTNDVILNYINNVANITWKDDYSFAATKDIPGDYNITGISIEGNTVTVKLDGNITSAIVNGKRLAQVSGNSSNIPMGEFLFNVSGFELIEGGFKFTLGAANVTQKDSEDSLYFDSSNEDLDFFLNDYFKRHSGVIEDGEDLKVNSAVAGVNSQEFFNHEWMSMSYYWYNSFEGYTDEKGNNSDRIAGLRKFLSTVPVDDYGYVWSSNDRVRDAYTDVKTGEQKMGWPFPNNDTVSTAHWEFNSSSVDGWSSNISAKPSGGLYGNTLSNQSSNITFTSKSFSGITSKRVYTFYAPLLEFEVRIDDATNVEDIYVWYTTSSSTSFSEDKKLSVKDKAFMNYDLGNTSGEYNHVLYLPMYAESAWGESTSTYMKQLKIEVALKSGKTISGNVALNYVRPTLDTRMSNNNSILISSLRTDYDYTGDLDFLAENITRARKAMNFLMQMYDSTRGLKKESYLVGHGGTKEDLNWLGNASNKSIASSISQGYWDIIYMPEYDFQSNMYFYKAARDMAYLEGVLADNGITVNESSTVKTATRNRTTGTSAYSYDLNSVANTVLTNLRQSTENTNHTGFWDAADGRFVAGYASGENKWYDYGYVAWNLEAIYYGIATEDQAKAIMNWLQNEGDLYKYDFAPISNTVTGDADMLNGEYAAQGDKWVNCQFGGAIMYTSFYDLMARIDTLGADNAFGRLTAIKDWYQEVYDYYVANGTDPYEFYRYYYDSKGIQCQGVGTAGSVGLDREFLESFLPVSAVAYGFFGIEANGATLNIKPELPSELDYWKAENLAFNFVKYDLKIYKNAIHLSNVRGNVQGLKLQVALDYVDGQTVCVNGVKTTNYTVENGKVYITVDFGATIVEVK